MKRKIVLMGVAAALTATALIGGSLAYFQADGQEVQQQMNTRTLSISLKDAGSGTLPEETVLFDDVMPGADLEMEHRLVVENTGDTPVYARVTLQKSGESMRIIPLPRNLTRTVLLSGWRPGTIGTSWKIRMGTTRRSICITGRHWKRADRPHRS